MTRLPRVDVAVRPFVPLSRPGRVARVLLWPFRRARLVAARKGLRGLSAREVCVLLLGAFVCLQLLVASVSRPVVSAESDSVVQVIEQWESWNGFAYSMSIGFVFYFLLNSAWVGWKKKPQGPVKQ